MSDVDQVIRAGEIAKQLGVEVPPSDGGPLLDSLASAGRIGLTGLGSAIYSPIAEKPEVSRKNIQGRYAAPEESAVKIRQNAVSG